MTSNRDIDRPIQIIKYTSRCEIILDEKALSGLLEKVKNEPVAVLSIAGPYRTGKSFLLNHLLRYMKTLECGNTTDWQKNINAPLTGFPWAPGSNVLTDGLSLWSRPFRIKLLDGKQVAVLLMDMQGMWGEHSSKAGDVTLLAISLLISSIQIYNAFHKIDWPSFEYMELSMEASRMILNECTSGHTSCHTKEFQRLVHIVRDWIDPKRYTFGQTGGLCYMNERLMGNNIQNNRSVVDNVHSAFDKVECFLMPFPKFKTKAMEMNSDPDDLSTDFSGALAEIDERFIKNLAKLAEFLMNPNEFEPKKFGEQEVTGSILCDRIMEYISIIQRGTLPLPSSTKQTLLREFNMMVFSESVGIFQEKSNEISLLSQSTLEDLEALRLNLGYVKNKTIEHFDKKIHVNSEYIKPLREKLLDILSGLESEKIGTLKQDLMKRQEFSETVIQEQARKYLQEMEALLLLREYTPEELDRRNQTLRKHISSELMSIAPSYMTPLAQWQNKLDEAMTNYFKDIERKNKLKYNKVERETLNRKTLEEALMHIDDSMEMRFGEDTTYAPKEDIQNHVVSLKDNIKLWFQEKTENAPEYYLREIADHCDRHEREYHKANTRKKKGESLDQPFMSKEHEERLTDMCGTLVERLDLSPRFLAQLKSLKVLPSRIVQDLQESSSTSDEKVLLLLDKLKKRPDSAFEGFLNALINADQSHLATEIESAV